MLQISGATSDHARMTLGHVLIVDDNAEMLDLLEEQLHQLHYSVDRAEGGREAMEKYVECRPDVVLLDLRMPEMPGDEVFERLNNIDGTVPIIIVSANKDLVLARKMLQRGAFDYVPKPSPPDYLERALVAALRKREELRRPA